MNRQKVAHLKTAPSESGGWISPFGDFYPCEIYQHDALAAQLADAWYSSPRGTALLEERGWAKVFGAGGCEVHPTLVNTDQLDTLLDILFASRNLVFREQLARCLKNVLAILEAL